MCVFEIAAILAVPNTHLSEAAPALMHVALSGMQTALQMITTRYMQLRAHMDEMGQRATSILRSE